MRTGAASVGWVFAAVVVAWATPAQAENLGFLDVGLTLEAHMNQGLIFRNEDQIIFEGAEDFDDSFPYPGFEGLGGLFGALVELRLGGFAGLEGGVAYSYNVLEQDVRGQPTTLTQSALHVPVWLKLYAGGRDGSIPQYEVFVMGVGAEYVSPFEPTLETRGRFIEGAESEAWWNLLVRLGAEFRLSNEALTREPVIRFDLLRLALRVDSIGSGRDVVRELPGQRLILGSAMDLQVGVGIGFGFFAL